MKVPHAAATGLSDPQRFLREIEAMKKYRHPALIRFLDHDARAPQPPTWVAVEYHLRGILDAEENRGGYRGNPMAVLKDIRPVADALGVVHRGGSVHRDVKPKNIFVSDDGHLILGDFGIVVPSVDATRLTAGEPAHSRDWVPDWVQFGDERTYTPAVDVFALAKVIYYLVAGENVMASQLPKRVAALQAKYVDAPGLGATLSLLERCIVDREEKVTIADGVTLTREIDDVLAGETQRPGQLLFSYLSVEGSTHRALEQAYDQTQKPPALPPVRGLDGLRILLATPARHLVGVARLLGNNGVIEFRVGDAVSHRQEFKGSGSTASPGMWTDPILLKADRPIPAGWHDLTVTGVGSSTSVTAFTLYAM